MTINPASRRIFAAVVAVLATAAVHGGWLSGMDRDAVATIQSIDA